jgi:hypothetical protein
MRAYGRAVGCVRGQYNVNQVFNPQHPSVGTPQIQIVVLVPDTRTRSIKKIQKTFGIRVPRSDEFMLLI